MVKFYSEQHAYDYSFPAVSLAYFLRYPNPYSTHVASTDTISRHFDPETQRLTTIRLHLKRSRMPAPVLKLLPRAAVGADGDGMAQSFIWEKSVVDIREGWMETESRNLDWNNVLSVIERQTYRRPISAESKRRTDVDVSVTLKSRIGEQLRKRTQRWGASLGGEEEATVKQGWFSSWSSGAIRSAIESISLQRTQRSQPKAQLGMSVVLDRLRNGGVQGVLEGMRRDRELSSHSQS